MKDVRSARRWSLLVIVLVSGCSDLTVPGATSPVPFEAPQVSADGRYVAYVSEPRIRIRPTRTRSPTCSCGTASAAPPPASPSPGSRAGLGGVSDDGRYVTYHSTQDDDASPTEADVYVWDRTTGVSTKITSAAYATAEAISGDGRFVLVLSAAPDDEPGHQNPMGMVDPYVWDRTTGELEPGHRSLDRPGLAASRGGDLSDDGRFVIWNATRVNDDPIPNDIYVADRTLGTDHQHHPRRRRQLQRLDLGRRRHRDLHHHGVPRARRSRPRDRARGTAPPTPSAGVTRSTTPLGDRPGPASANGRFVAITRPTPPSRRSTGRRSSSSVRDRRDGAPGRGAGHEVAGQPSNDGLTVPVSRYPSSTPPPQSGEVHVWRIGDLTGRLAASARSLDRVVHGRDADVGMPLAAAW